ncbi:MAG: hypothetical protein E6105_06835 [Finegoldia magna]|jgi:hypothetical protein|nr:hypothetical protein [Finegoldia magna]
MTNDKIVITGFDKNKSVYDKENETFKLMIFTLSETPTEEWAETYRSNGYMSYNVTNCQFKNKELHLLNFYCPINELQSFVDDLKGRFEKVNMKFEEIKYEDQSYHSTIDNLKF